MHPIERLRYVARSVGAPQDALVAETAIALSAFADDPTALVTACRRIVSRQLTCGGLWWLCSRLLCSADPRADARAAVAEVSEDSTGRHLVASLPADATVVVVGWPPLVGDALVRRGDLTVRVVDGDDDGAALVHHLGCCDVDAVEVPPAGVGAAVASADLVLLEASVAGTGGFIAATGSLAAAAVARAHDVEVWLAVGVGRALPARVWDALVARFDDHLGDEPWEASEELVGLGLVDRVVVTTGTIAPAELASIVDCPIAPELFRADIT